MDSKWLKKLFYVSCFLFVFIFYTSSCKKDKNKLNNSTKTPEIAASNTQQKGLSKVDNFGSNPGNLTMYRYIPNTPLQQVPLVVVLHGCTQSVSDVLHDTEWDKLAEKYGFILVLPETKIANNVQKCFNWFDSGDQARNAGEPLSIMQMIDNIKANFSVNGAQVFVTGLSAGAAMTAVMLAAYPDVFKSGAIIAGGPYKSATGALSAASAMNGSVSKTPVEWGSLVRSAYAYSGNYPTIAIFHGIQDATVNINNANELVKQWTNVLQADQTADSTINSFNGVNDVSQYKYLDSNSRCVVTYFKINNLAHALPVYPGTGYAQGGQTGSYAVNKNFYAPFWVGKFFGIIP
ncbi:MAG: PHB depolymerase family esterase [Chitinophagaceae bacterium]|nr:PHB depolymerase family esterase [Chitinophagaceae bacterium]